MGRILDLDFDNISTTINKDGITLVDFWAEWCQPCKAFAPIYEEMANEYPDLQFTKIDVDAQKEIADEADIQNVPTIMVFKNGKPVYRKSGSLTAEELKKVIDAITEG